MPGKLRKIQSATDGDYIVLRIKIDPAIVSAARPSSTGKTLIVLRDVAPLGVTIAGLPLSVSVMIYSKLPMEQEAEAAAAKVRAAQAPAPTEPESEFSFDLHDIPDITL